MDKCAAVLAFADRGEEPDRDEHVDVRKSSCFVVARRCCGPVGRTVTALFNRSIVTMALTRRIAEEARELVWEHGVKPEDAIHVASALASGAAVLNTFDRDLAARSGTLGEPPLTIEPFRNAGTGTGIGPWTRCGTGPGRDRFIETARKLACGEGEDPLRRERSSGSCRRRTRNRRSPRPDFFPLPGGNAVRRRRPSTPDSPTASRTRPPRAGLRGRRIRAIERLSRIGRPPCTASGRAVRVPCRGPPAA